MTECFIKNNDVSRTCNICRKEHFSKEIHLWSISIFSVRQVTSALKKKKITTKPAHTNMFQVLSYYNINMRLSLVYVCTPLDEFPHTHILWHKCSCLCMLAHKHCTHMLSFSHIINPPSSGTLSHKHRRASYLLLHQKTMWTICHYLISQPKLSKYVPSQPQTPQSAFLAIHSPQIDHCFCSCLPNINLFSIPSLLLPPCVPLKAVFCLSLQKSGLKQFRVEYCIARAKTHFATGTIPQTIHQDK